MTRILAIGLLASTMLSMSMPAAAAPTNGREDSPRVQRNDGGGIRALPQRGGMDGRPRWSPSANAQRPQPTSQRPAPAARAQPVPPSSASSDWRRTPDARRPVTADPQVRGERSRNWSDNRDRTTMPARPPLQARPDRNGNWQRDRDDNDRDRNRDRAREWRDNDRNWARDRPDRNWNGNNGRDWNNADRGRDYNYQRRLEDRDRWADQHRWNNSWRNDRRYDWQSYRAQHRSHYRLPSYYAPYGWNYGYSRFSIGIFLNSLLFDQNYWISDPYYYRLPPAYGSLRWVRYYDDALLVDVRDGYVVDVIHDFFW